MKHFLLGCILALSGLFVNSGTQAQSAPQFGASTAIVNSSTGLCWDVVDFSTSDGAVIQFFPCTGSSNQSWAFQTYGFSGDTAMVRIVNVNSGMCAGVEDVNPASGNIGLRQYVCNVNDPLQQFYVQSPVQTITVGTNTFSIPLLARHITSVATHWCLLVDPNFNRPIEQPSCGATGNQASRWKMSGI